MAGDAAEHESPTRHESVECDHVPADSGLLAGCTGGGGVEPAAIPGPIPGLDDTCDGRQHDGSGVPGVASVTDP